MKKMLISDLHIGARNSNQNISTMIKKYFFEFLIPQIEEQEIEEVFILGDVLDNRTRISFKSLRLLYKIFEKISKQCKIKILLGNHDIYLKNDTKISGTKELLENIDNIEIIDSVYEYENFVMIPWITSTNCNSIIEGLKPINNKGSKFLLGHLDISGFRMVGNHLSESNSLDKKILNDFYHVYTGHYHISQTKENFTYIGSPYQLTWNDYTDKKRVIVYDSEKETFDSLYTPDKYSLFTGLKYDDSIKIDNIDKDQFREKYVRIYLPKEYNKSKFQRFFSLFQEQVNPIKVNIIYTEHEKESVSNITLQNNDLEKLMNDYCEEYCQVEGLETKNRAFIKDKLNALYSQCLQEII